VLAFRSAYPEFRNTKLVIVTEANSRFDGDYVQRVLSRMGQFRGEGVGADTIGEVCSAAAWRHAVILLLIFALLVTSA
jgi:hypothetical protein